MNDKAWELWMNIKLYGEILDQEVLEENDVACFVKRTYKYKNNIYEAFIKSGKIVALVKNDKFFDWDDEEVSDDMYE